VRFEKLAEGHFWLSEKPSEPGSKSWDSSLTRMASWVRLRDLATGGGRGGTPLLFVNTHWDHKGPAARLESAKLIRRKLREFQPAGPVVLVGDFNATEDDAPYAEFIKPADGAAPKLVDAYRALYPERSKDEASFHGFKGGVAGSRIDWILHTPEFRPTEAAIDRAREGERYPSDHYPVTAVLGRSGS
jgi:endonuclease/exonuclease/phosphatase family metal-dependent hydrolase